ncbi:VIT1/CCC1 transporter family protein [Poseidonocella sedimentorum]|uniref:Predicted Fe2+/Mn2+ transporter, VIT1/CCC1 family n=1 Tax=Poseidonocella sedimentorum TaxID=871652 RepID=A0A1I6DW26_9RHOB|nr:VIT1/CCC1 transporter family protein [Poseidonocella sedimentorum]SFR09488.1 Predicted Fe2+/Mn2+ transporter, VIT1/CCC1 family [Poseidonocella sedimentorum]
MTDEHGHTPTQIAERLARRNTGTQLRDIVYGAIDGAVTTFAIVAGVEGAGLSHGVILALGAANILADGFSMAAGNFAGTRAELDDRRRVLDTERRHLRDHRAGELEELRQILQQQGLSGDILDGATEAISHNEERWIALMLTEEYGLARDAPRPIRAALTTFLSFLCAGIVPLLPFVLGLANAFVISVVSTLAVFFLIGAAKSRWSLAPWWRSGLETFLIGSSAAAIAYLVASLFR